ncbi:MAG: UDP pyrophosphate phosphatase [Sulfurovum sp. PC08-66]|nr:MAG: UDP pyrophosphate phosphatase [Sulfurovum sp. PC08-66]KIM12653.1 MAG: UDP pyrophosphate phosphatase [Sulfuricurvum sp. PC08-66]
MTYWDAIILAIVEGITEYLPVSSTAHLILTAQLLGLAESAFLTTFNIVIQTAPILSVMLIYRAKLISSIELWKKLIVAFIPTGIIGLFFADAIESLFTADLTLFWMVATGVAFIAIEKFYNEKEHYIDAIEKSSYVKAASIGLFQSIALIPGVSRSGITILGAMLLGYKREAAMAFSFLLAIPTMGAASGYTLLKGYSTLDFAQWELLGLAFVVAFVVGWVVVKLLLSVVARFSFIPFGVYLIASALLYALFLD